jgi:hypothetical protein
MYAALFVPKFVREEIEITYKFEPLGKQPALPQDARKLRVNQEIRYLARNVIDKPVNHSSTPREDILVCDPENKATPFKEFLMEIVGSNPPQKIHLRELGELSAETQNQGMRYTLKTQTLKDVKPGQVVRAVLAIAKICRYADTDTWVTSYPAKQLRIKVDVAGSPPPDLEFWVDQAHRQKMVPVPESERPKALSYEWRLNFPILPYQGVMLRWRPRQRQSAMNGLPVEGSGATEL